MLQVTPRKACANFTTKVRRGVAVPAADEEEAGERFSVLVLTPLRGASDVLDGENDKAGINIRRLRKIDRARQLALIFMVNCYFKLRAQFM